MKFTENRNYEKTKEFIELITTVARLLGYRIHCKERTSIVYRILSDQNNIIISHYSNNHIRISTTSNNHIVLFKRETRSQEETMDILTNVFQSL